MTIVIGMGASSGLMLWTFISVAIVAIIISVIALIARAVFRRGRIKH